MLNAVRAYVRELRLQANVHHITCRIVEEHDARHVAVHVHEVWRDSDETVTSYAQGPGAPLLLKVAGLW